MKKNKSASGFSLVEVLVALAAGAFVAVASLTTIIELQKASIKNSRKASFSAISDKLLSVISQQKAWDKTITQNPVMSCIKTVPISCAAGTTATISLYDSAGTRLTYAVGPRRGFRANGGLCNTFGETGSDCLYQAKVVWSVHCTTAISCKFPEERIQVEFKYAGPEKFNVAAFNVPARSRRNLASNFSPVSVCAEANDVFAGFGKAVYNGSGVIFNSDSNGCVPLAAFEGPQGPMGAQGPAGANGAPGAIGPRGDDGIAYIDTPPPPPPPLPAPASRDCTQPAYTDSKCYVTEKCPVGSPNGGNVVAAYTAFPAGGYNVTGTAGQYIDVARSQVFFYDPSYTITRWDPFNVQCDPNGSGNYALGTLDGWCGVDKLVPANDPRCLAVPSLESGGP